MYSYIGQAERESVRCPIETLSYIKLSFSGINIRWVQELCLVIMAITCCGEAEREQVSRWGSSWVERVPGHVQVWADDSCVIVTSCLATLESFSKQMENHRTEEVESLTLLKGTEKRSTWATQLVPILEDDIERTAVRDWFVCLFVCSGHS